MCSSQVLAACFPYEVTPTFVPCTQVHICMSSASQAEAHLRFLFSNNDTVTGQFETVNHDAVLLHGTFAVTAQCLSRSGPVAVQSQ